MSKWFIGVDPGVSGGIAAVSDSGALVTHASTDVTRNFEWLMRFVTHSSKAVIEMQTARPSRYRDKKTGKMVNTILASTVTLYGSYKSLETLLTIAGIPIVEHCPPKRWQAYAGVSKNGAEQSKWKSQLADVARKAFPGNSITLATADAVLIALYCRSIGSQ